MNVVPEEDRFFFRVWFFARFLLREIFTSSLLAFSRIPNLYPDLCKAALGSCLLKAPYKKM